MQQLKWLWSKDSMNSTINQRLVEQTQEMNFKLEGSGGAAPGDTLSKALQTLFGEYYFLYFRRCENMMFMDQTSLFLASLRYRTAW